MPNGIAYKATYVTEASSIVQMTFSNNGCQLFSELRAKYTALFDAEIA